MLAKASNEDPAAHDRNAVWLRAAIPARPAAAEIGWIGGNPKLPDPFQWPGRDGQPYQFLCQINCASLPPSLWGGVGPRAGWLAFFAAVSGRIDVKVIHQPTLGPQRGNERAWQKSATGLYWVDDKYDGLLAPPPRWPLDFVHPVDGEAAFQTGCGAILLPMQFSPSHRGSFSRSIGERSNCSCRRRLPNRGRGRRV
ncbi:hypothetical protein AOQ73_03265 [Bradyrhizobium pachyrhizi]|nr:hypothetical protein AOQ73_03265 [Bradyrhizobium pachyrhizi]